MKIRTLALALAVVLPLGFATAASAAMIALSAVIDCAQEVPPSCVVASGTGSANITLDTATNVLSWDISFSGLTGPALAMHL